MLKNKVPSALINKIISRFNQLNSDIENDPSLGAGFSIGHSYFCDCTQANDTWYQEIIEHDIKPILEEYWFDSPEKVERFIYELLK